MITLKQYDPSMKPLWDRLVADAKNATFIHRRDYMDYHRQRFADSSLIAYRDNAPVALLPANRVDDTLYSHQGLTYGGWLTRAAHFDVAVMLQIFDAMSTYLPAQGINRLIYKPAPHIYHTYPAEEDLYAIFRYGGRIVGSNVSATVPIKEALRFNENARRGLRQAIASGAVVAETDDLAPYWAILTDLLRQRYGVAPVHTLQEMQMLKDAFPANIRLFTATIEERTVAGVLIYDTGRVAHAQYIAASEEGKRKKVLPLIFDYLINKVYAATPYFDFGTSNEDGGHYLNEGLSRQKTGMGGRAIVYNTYEINF